MKGRKKKKKERIIGIIIKRKTKEKKKMPISLWCDNIIVTFPIKCLKFKWANTIHIVKVYLKRKRIRRRYKTISTDRGTQLVSHMGFGELETILTFIAMHAEKSSGNHGNFFF